MRTIRMLAFSVTQPHLYFEFLEVPMAGKAFGYDYKEEWVENERRRQKDSTTNWIYIGVDTGREDIAKIGLTTGSLGTRSSGTQNPFYALFCAFKIKEGVKPNRVATIEKSIKEFLSESYRCIPHRISGKPSEWFYVTPIEMRECVNYFLYKYFSYEMNCYYCFDRDIGIIYSWENPEFRQGRSRPRYQATDLSDPPVDSNCYMSGGCGRDCDCWD